MPMKDLLQRFWPKRRPAPDAIERLIGKLEKKKGRPWCEVVDALGRSGDPRAVAPLVKALEHTTYGADHEAVTAGLLRLGKHSVDALGKAVVNSRYGSDHNARMHAAQILGQIGDRRAVNPLIQALYDRHESVIHAAARSLAALGDVRALDPILNALNDGSAHAQSTLREVGQKFGPRALDPYIRALGDPDNNTRLHAVSALHRLGGPEAIDPLIKALDDPDSLVRSTASSGLATLHASRAVAPLCRILRDGEFHDRASAARDLAILGNWDALEPLVEALKDPDPRIRDEAAWALGYLGDLRAVEPLCRVIGQTRSTAAECALGPTTRVGREASKALEEALKSPDPDIRLGAGCVLEDRGYRSPAIPATGVQSSFPVLKARLVEGLSYDQVLAILGSPSQVIQGSTVLGAFGKVGGSAGGISTAGGMVFVEWKRREGTYRATFTGGVLTEMNAFPA